jgi:hypothetical protein
VSNEFYGLTHHIGEARSKIRMFKRLNGSLQRAYRGVGRARRHLHLARSPRPCQAQAPLRLRGSRRAERQEHRAADPRLPSDPRRDETEHVGPGSGSGAERGARRFADLVLAPRDSCVVEYEPDADLRDTEQVPLLEAGGIEAFIKREVLPYASDAWFNEDATKIGYEISFNRYFYKPQPLRSLDEIKKDILVLEKETEGLLKEIVGSSV